MTGGRRMGLAPSEGREERERAPEREGGEREQPTPLCRQNGRARAASGRRGGKVLSVMTGAEYVI